MESQPQNPEFRNNPENFHPCKPHDAQWWALGWIFLSPSHSWCIVITWHQCNNLSNTKGYCIKRAILDLSEANKQKLPFINFVWFDSLRPINNLSVIKGQVFLGWTSTKLGLMFLLKDTAQWCWWAQTLGPSVSSQALYHWATALPSSISSPKFTKSVALYFVAISQSMGVHFHKYLCSRAKPYIRVIYGSSVIKCSGLEGVHLRYQICALTACDFVVCWFLSKSTFSKYSFRKTIWVSNRLDPDQARHFVGPKLGPNCLQKLSTDDNVRFYLFVWFDSLHPINNLGSSWVEPVLS